MARPNRPSSCEQCQKLCSMEPEAIRPKCWYGRRCPLQMAERHPEVLTAYEFAMTAVSRFEHEKGEKAGQVEYSTTRGAIKFACWARGLSKRDRLQAIELVTTAVRGCEFGIDWVTGREVAEVLIGTEHEKPEHRLILSLDAEEDDG